MTPEVVQLLKVGDNCTSEYSHRIDIRTNLITSDVSVLLIEQKKLFIIVPFTNILQNKYLGDMKNRLCDSRYIVSSDLIRGKVYNGNPMFNMDMVQ